MPDLERVHRNVNTTEELNVVCEFCDKRRTPVNRAQHVRLVEPEMMGQVIPDRHCIVDVRRKRLREPLTQRLHELAERSCEG